MHTAVSTSSSPMLSYDTTLSAIYTCSTSQPQPMPDREIISYGLHIITLPLSLYFPTRVTGETLPVRFRRCCKTAHMAKGRKLTTSRSERFLGSFSHGQGQDTTVADSSELGEEDVWSVVDDGVDRDSDWIPCPAESNGTVAPRPPRRVPRTDRHAGGLSLAFDDCGKTTASPRVVHQFRSQNNGVTAAPQPPTSHAHHHLATSLPVNVPDWQKILCVDSVESMPDSDDGAEDPDTEWIPPHEYVAREYARSRAATSVFEGVGRTLKGRDMSRVRDAVWRQTGFYG
ncbi:protein S40-5 [Malania oleifera]|uniref:protein S40-5 n=1 Tax=Malania oleifera TaxID=397392 RepID=UPI0025AD9D50|nr:protein S40-5 [Malania oleifera]